MTTKSPIHQRSHRETRVESGRSDVGTPVIPSVHFKITGSPDTSRSLHSHQAAQPAQDQRLPHLHCLSHISQSSKTAIPLFAMDCLGLVFCVFAAAILTSTLFAASPLSFQGGWSLQVNCVVFVLLYALLGLYPGVGINPIVELKYLMMSSLTSGAILLVFALAVGNPSLPLFAFILTLTLLNLAVAPLCRCSARGLFSHFSWWGQPALIIGGRESSLKLMNVLEQKSALGLRPIGMVNNQVHHVSDNDAAEGFLGTLPDLSHLAIEHKVFWALIAPQDPLQDNMPQTLQCCSTIPNVVVIPGFEEFPSLWNRTQDFGGVLGICFRERLLDPWAQFCKRTFDLIAIVLGGCILLPLLLPLLLVTWICMKLHSPGPIFYGQERVGKDGHRFQAWKFRTMVVDAESALTEYLKANPDKRREWDLNQKLRQDPRIIPGMGMFLRKTSLDELPQLWNVLIGDMSLVGPRPFMTDQLEMYGNRMTLYRKVRPGITGLWQISGRNHTTFEERSHFDAYYVRNWSFWLDLFILGRTVKTVLFREGAF